MKLYFFSFALKGFFSVFDSHVKINISIFGEWVDVFAFCNWIINYHHHYNLQLIQFSQQIKWVRASDQIVLISLPLTQTNRNTHFEKEFWQIQIPLQIQLSRSRRQTKALWFPVTAQNCETGLQLHFFSAATEVWKKLISLVFLEFLPNFGPFAQKIFCTEGVLYWYFTNYTPHKLPVTNLTYKGFIHSKAEPVLFIFKHWDNLPKEQQYWG